MRKKVFGYGKGSWPRVLCRKGKWMGVFNSVQGEGVCTGVRRSDLLKFLFRGLRALKSYTWLG